MELHFRHVLKRHHVKPWTKATRDGSSKLELEIASAIVFGKANTTSISLVQTPNQHIPRPPPIIMKMRVKPAPTLPVRGSTEHVLHNRL